MGKSFKLEDCFKVFFRQFIDKRAQKEKNTRFLTDCKNLTGILSILIEFQLICYLLGLHSSEKSGF